MRTAAMLTVVIGCFALALAGSLTPAEAAACQTITGPGTFTLSADIVADGFPGDTCNPGDDPLLQLNGPLTLDMAGFKVDCGTPATTTGIRMLGSGVVLKNGLVTRCRIGVDVDGTGNHKVQSVVAKSNNVGFNVSSNKNELTNSSAVTNAVGFLIDGNQNKLDKDTATESPGEANFKITGNENTINNSVAAYGVGHGFLVIGDKNKLGNDTATGATLGHDGFKINVGSSLNELNGNVASDNEGNGFNNEGNTNKFTNNVATGNDQRGFRNHASDSNRYENNTAVYNLDGIRLGSGSNNNLVKGNRTFGNRDDGIDVNGTTNTIQQNTSLGNGNNDLEDDNGATCDTNIWTGNIFGTKSQACIN